MTLAATIAHAIVSCLIALLKGRAKPAAFYAERSVTTDSGDDIADWIAQAGRVFGAHAGGHGPPNPITFIFL